MKTVWLLGNFDDDMDLELSKKGYAVKRFQATAPLAMDSDSYPDMIFFSDLTPENASLFMKINQFFPSTLVVSMPSTQADKKADDNRLGQAMDRLIKNLPDNESVL